MHKSVHPATPVTLTIRPEAVERFKRRAKVQTDRDFAYVIGYDPGQMSRVLAGKAVPGPKFVAGVARTFGWHALKDIFDWIPADFPSSEGAA